MPHFAYSSKPDPLPAKAETISDAGGPSVVTYLRNYKKCCTGPKKGVRKNMGNSPEDLKVREEGKEEVLQVKEQQFFCSLWGNLW